VKTNQTIERDDVTQYQITLAFIPIFDVLMMYILFSDLELPVRYWLSAYLGLLQKTYCSTLAK